mgnify:CR=1 FL=1
MLNILYTELAEQDLFNLFEIISKDKPTVAVEYITKLEKHIELLQYNPELGLECKNKNINKDCRILIYEDYLIFYRTSNKEIHIIRILNSRTNYTNKI